MTKIRFRHLAALVAAGTSITLLSCGPLLDRAAETPHPLPVYGLCFSPYMDGQAPPDSVPVSQVRERLGIVAPTTSWVRTYGSLSGLETIPVEARALGLKSLAGAFINQDAGNNATQIDNLITNVKKGCVQIAFVGNETLRAGSMTSGQLASLILDVRQRLDTAGFSDIPVGTAEPFEVLFDRGPGGELVVNHPDLVIACDCVGLNLYPFWQGVDIADAIQALDTQYREAVQAINAVSPRTRVLITETGWPSGGNVIGSAEPSSANAARYYAECVNWATNNNLPLFYFEAFDESWKKEPLGIEDHWGLWDAAGQLKPAFAVP